MSVGNTHEFQQLCDANKSPPDVFAFLRQHADAEASDVLAVLLCDQKNRWQIGHPLAVEDYLSRLPELTSDSEVRLQLAVGEFQARQQQTPSPSIDEFTSRFADIGDVLFNKLSELASDGQVSVGREPPTGTQTYISESAIGDERVGRYRLVRLLGEGAFGRVFLGFDEELKRQVAIKVPTPERFQKLENAESYLAEARAAATLDHPNIVPVYDMGRAGDGSVYVVSKFIEGRTLGERIKADRPTHDEAARLLATVAQALHHAHQRRLIHRDVKPDNILIEDESGTPYVADFGLAVGEGDTLEEGKIAGTPAYMSPEQARGEGHRLDARSDIFSLGVVLCELLTGENPFRGSTMNEVLHRVISVDPTPPRELDNTIPAELERICLRALSKRTSDRYATAAELADDLQHWQQGPQQASQELKIVPKGLRSFDADDADFFLDLLPGPRGRDGLPESIRFWKTRIEETDPDKTFSVGLIYGPSGCGKSSLVKAGLLPRLSEDVVAVYVESTAEETETRILRGLRKRLPDLPDSLGIVETFTLLRRAEGPKVTIVLDQFEQWLHAHRTDENTDLVGALRQCDGVNVQCVVMLRDDFWMAASRFMADVEVEILQGANVAAVDLFSVKHAQKVLKAFGRAYGDLDTSLNNENEVFLEKAATGLAQDDKVVCVRLALFAEMVKGKPWTAATLQQVGGTEGIGFDFLEETFSSRTANPKHRLHQEAAREVLKALLPEVGSDIKGTIRSHSELLQASGYSSRPRDFGELLRMLDGELRLMTPTDPEGPQTESGSDPGSKYYQLTHDYLVPALRRWLTQKKRETRRGRAELRLEERAALWNAKPENRHLPSLIEWASIRTLTSRKNWTEPQRRMMRRAGWFRTVRFSILVIVLVLLGWSGFEAYGTLRGSALVESLKTANIDGVPRIVDELIGYRRWTNDELHSLASENNTDADTRLHASLALLPTDPTQLGYLQDRLLNAEPEQFETIRSLLANHKDEIVDDLWRVAENPNKGEEKQLLQAASALAVYDNGNDAKWTGIAGRVVEALVSENSLRVAVLTETLKPARRHLVKPLGVVYRSKTEDRSQTQIDLATDILEQYAADDLDTLMELLLDGRPKQFVTLFDKFEAYGKDALSRLNAELDRHPLDDWKDAEKETLARRQANAAVAALRMGQAEKVWPLLKHSPDPRLRTWIIHRISPLGASPDNIVKRLDEEPDVSIRRALILILGEYEDKSQMDRKTLSANLLGLYRGHPDPGIHAAAEWVLRRLGHATNLAEIDTELATGKVEGERNWYITKQGHTMVVIPGPVEFLMGSPDTEKDRRDDESLHRKRIGHSFAVASKEVTVKQFQEFLRQTPSVEHSYLKRYAPEENCPQQAVTWYEAAAYCRWLSEQEGIPESQMCYPPTAEIKEGMKVPSDYLSRTGCRLPSEAEWEYACRSKTITSHYYGQTEELLGQYTWFSKTSRDRTWPVGSLKPNDMGLFDMYGNVYEWCQERYVSFDGSFGSVSEDREDNVSLRNSDHRLLRGCSFITPSSNARSAFRFPIQPTVRVYSLGFRPSRTLR